MEEPCAISHATYEFSILSGKVDLVLMGKSNLTVDNYLNFIKSLKLNALDPKIGFLIGKDKLFFTELSRADTKRKIDGRQSIQLHEITRVL